MRILIIGAGGHAQVVADVLLQSANAGRSVEVVGYLDDDHTIHGQTRLGLPVLGAIGRFDRIPHDGVIVGIGHNETRSRLYEMLVAHGELPVTALHPSAIVGNEVCIGTGSVLCAGVIVNPGSTTGANVILNTGCTVDHHNAIGDHVHVAPGAHLGGDVTCGSGSLIGLGAAILPQRSIGAWCTIGAGSVVTTDVADRSTVVGVPARPIIESK